jgi:hypothetical protein
LTSRAVQGLAAKRCILTELLEFLGVLGTQECPSRRRGFRSPANARNIADTIAARVFLARRLKLILLLCNAALFKKLLHRELLLLAPSKETGNATSECA